MKQKLMRSRTDEVIAGVCGGIGRYLGIDSTLVRLFFVLLALADGMGVLLYILLAIIMPQAPEGSEVNQITLEGEETPMSLAERHPQSNLVVGVALLLLGAVFLMQNFHISFVPWVDFGALWPLLLIAAGGILLWRQVQERGNVR